MSGRGRPALERGVLPLSILPPAIVVVDTSAAVAALLADQAQHAEYAEFLARCVERGTTFAYCDLLQLELAEACVAIALKRQHKNRWANHRHDGRALRPARRLLDDVLVRWRSTLAQSASMAIPLGSADHASTDIPTITEEALALVRAYPAIRSYDAAHAVTAQLLGAPLLTRDTGFARLPASSLIVITDSTRLSACRAIRARPERQTRGG